MVVRKPLDRALRQGAMICAVALAGCSVFGDRLDPDTVATTQPVPAVQPAAAAPAATPAAATAETPAQTASLNLTPEQLAAAKATEGTPYDYRRFVGPDYCPELRVPDGTQLVREYVPGHEGDPKEILWQASVGKTARECLYDLQNNLTLKIGISGRVITGPKGAPGTVTVPLRVAIEKFKEGIVKSEYLPLTVTIPATNSTTFTEVREIVIPTPAERDYIIRVGLVETDEELLNPQPEEEPAVAAVDEEEIFVEEPPPAAAPEPPPKPKEPEVIPVPDDYVVN
jgi:hypothetical protein